MKESKFKNSSSKLRTDAHFTKDDEALKKPLSKSDEEELVMRAMDELVALFSKLSDNGFEKGELDISLAERSNGLSICIMRSDGNPLSISEVNLICRLAIDSHLSPRAAGNGVEIISTFPLLTSAKLYNRVVLLIKEKLNK